jgi:hypothetical protein
VTKKRLEDAAQRLVANTLPHEAEGWIREVKVAGVAFGPWQVSEAVKAKNYDTAYAEETEPKNWKALNLEPGKVVAVVGQESAYAYVRSSVVSPIKQAAVLQLGSDDGVKVWLNGKLVHSNNVQRGATGLDDKVSLELEAGENKIQIKIVNGGGGDGLQVVLGSERDSKLLAAKALLDKPGNEAKLAEAYLLLGPENEAATKFRNLQAEATKFEASVPLALVAKELMKPRKAHILRRGEYDLKEKEVGRAVPVALGELEKTASKDRMGFAKWLTSPKHPLFARVFVNRVWQQHFGTGLVKTAEDFGNQGEWPSHPELLDYLSVRFTQDGYSLKKFHKLLLMSSTFRQGARITKEKLLLDPENRLLSRGPRFRLDAEVLRDQVLHVSGLLLNRSGGKGFKPYQPAGLWEEITFPGSNTSRYVQDMNSEIYRRSLYLFWKRTSPHPAMLAFDAPMREACVVRRPRTNTPLQSLVTMNEPAYLEASRVFAEDIVRTKTGEANRLNYAFRKALSRTPSAQESSLIYVPLSGIKLDLTDRRRRRRRFFRSA